MLKRISFIGAMLVGVATMAAAAGENPGSPEPGNLLPDVSDTQSWLVTNIGGVMSNAATAAPEDGAMRVQVTKLREQAARGDTGLGCMGVGGIKAGKAYTLRFTAKASEPREITISAMEPGKRGESIIGQANTELKTSWQTYTCRVVPTREGTAKTRLPFFEFGDRVGTVWFRNVTLVPADGDTSAAAPAPAPAAPANAAPPVNPAQGGARNYLAGGAGRDQWIVSQKGSATGTVDQEANQLRINVTAAASDRWNFRLQHRGFGIAAGQTATLKFSAKASAPRKMTISSQQAAPPMGDLTDEAVLDVSTDWQEYTCKFTFQKGSAPPGDMFPIIELGDQVGTVWLRDLTLTKSETRNGGGGQPAQAAAPAPATPATPAAPANPAPRAAAEGASPGLADIAPLTSIPDMTVEGTYRYLARGPGGARKEGDALFLNFAKRHPIPAETELRYSHLAYAVGKSYRLKFSAKAGSPLRIKVAVQVDVDGDNGEDLIAPVPIALTTEWQDVDMKLEFTKPNPDPSCSLRFLMGDKPNTVSLRNMSIVPE